MNSHEVPRASGADALSGDASIGRPPQVVLALKLEAARIIFTAVAMALGWGHINLRESTAHIVLVLALTLLLMAWILYKIYVGRNWARILYLILSIPIPFNLMNDTIEALRLDAPLLTTTSGIIHTGITIAVLWLLFTRPGSTWFRSRHRVPAA